VNKWPEDIEDRRRQIHRQRSEIQALQRAGISTVSAEELLARMLAKVNDLAAERDRIVGEQRLKYPGTLIGRTLANRYRDDLADAGLGSGNHCLEFKAQTNIRLEPRSIEVRRSLDGSSPDLSGATRGAG